MPQPRDLPRVRIRGQNHSPALPSPAGRSSTRPYELPHRRACPTTSAQARAVTLTWHPTGLSGVCLTWLKIADLGGAQVVDLGFRLACGANVRTNEGL